VRERERERARERERENACVRVSVRAFMCVRVRVCVYVCMCVCVYVCMCVWVYICISHALCLSVTNKRRLVNACKSISLAPPPPLSHRDPPRDARRMLVNSFMVVKLTETLKS
jgi:hypothetical protein